VGGGQQLKAQSRQDGGDRYHGKSKASAMPSPPRPDIERVYPNCEFSASFMNDRLTAADHVITLLSSSSSLMYAMRVLRVHGTPTASLHDIFQATVVSRIQYASPAWSGMCSARVSTRYYVVASGSGMRRRRADRR